jgi:hypothetical protein
MYFLKRHKKSIVIIVLSVVLSALACSFIGNISEGFTNFEDASILKRNEDNLLEGTFTEYNNGDGVSAKGRNDGSILLSGKNGTDAAIEFEIEKLSLAAGQYTVSGAPNGGNSTYHIAVQYMENGETKTAISDFNVKTLTITSPQEVTVKVVIYPDVDVKGVLLKPVIVSGTEIGDFYA